MQNASRVSANGLLLLLIMTHILFLYFIMFRSEHRHIFVRVKKLRLQRGLYPDSYTRHDIIFHSGTSDNIVNLASVKYQKRKRTVGVDGRR